MSYFGATTPTLAITAATAGMTGYLYRCRVTNEVGVDYSEEAELTVTAVPPSVSPLYLYAGGTPSTLTGGTPYATEALAIADAQTFDMATSNGIVDACVAWFTRTGATPGGNIVAGASSFVISAVADVGAGYVVFSATAGDVLSIPDGLANLWLLYDAATGAPLIGGPGNNSYVIPATGDYMFQCDLATNPSWTVSTTGAFEYGEVIAIWNDGGTPTELEACP